MQTYQLNTVQFTLISLVALLCTVAATAAAVAAPDTSRKAISWDQVGAKAGAAYQGDGLRVTPTAEGARLHCVFQRLDGEATRQGLWLTSTASGGGQFRLVATVVGREQSSVRSGMCIAKRAARVAQLRRSDIYSRSLRRCRRSAGQDSPFMPLLRSLAQPGVVVTTNMALLTELELPAPRNICSSLNIERNDGWIPS